LNGSERSLSGVEEEGTVDRLLAHVRALRNEVERLRDELNDPDAELLSVEEAAARLNVSERTVRSFVSDGTIPSAKIRRRRLIPREAVDEFIRSCTEEDTLA